MGSFLRVGLLVLSLAPLAVACSAAGDDVSDGDDVSEAEANVARITPGEFKMYDQPRATPDPSCDVHTKLSLTADRGSRAKLEEVVGGPCEIAVFPNAREYRLRLDETSCGSKIYTGSIRRNGERNTLKVTDHRTRTCRDIVPAKIIVEEFTGNGFAGPLIRKLYSLDAAPAAQTITVDGTLKRVVGIGGESTGRAIFSSAGSFELVLDESERGDFVDGRKARVTGTRITLSGVETHDRPAIDVTKLLVCPASGAVFNCMPPTAPGDTACGADRSFLSTCPGVSYLD